MNSFSELCSLLNQVSSADYKKILLKEYLDSSTDSDILWALYLLSGRKLRRSFDITGLWEILPELAGLPEWLIDESYQVSNDKAETISLILPVDPDEKRITLSEMIKFADDISELPDSAKLEKIINILKSINAEDKLLFLKLITGAFRSGINKKDIAAALSEKYSITIISAFHFLSAADPYEDKPDNLLKYYKRNKKIFSSYPFCSAQNQDTASVFQGDCKQWLAEWKWDGLRVQVIYRKGELLIWSKSGELVTEKFPELFRLSQFLEDGTVIEGEIIAFSKGRPLHFSILQKRLSLKTVPVSLTDDFPAALIAFDILEFNGNDIRSMPLTERRKILASVTEKSSDQEIMYLSPLLEFKSWKALAEIKKSAAENNCKGIVLKKKVSAYSGNDWLSLNLEPYIFNAVLLYAQKSLNSEMYSEFTFGAWHNDELITFAKTSGGLNEVDLIEISDFIKANTIEKFGPVRTVKPELVFEIHFEGISESKRHKSGITLRNPRIHRWHKDKKPHEAGYLSNLLELLNAGK